MRSEYTTNDIRSQGVCSSFCKMQSIFVNGFAAIVLEHSLRYVRTIPSPEAAYERQRTSPRSRCRVLLKSRHSVGNLILIDYGSILRNHIPT